MTPTGPARTREALLSHPSYPSDPSGASGRASGRPGPGHLRLVPAAASARRRRASESRRPVPAQPLPPLRLTRRGRVVLRGLVAVAMAALMVAVALGMAHRADAADRPGAPVLVAHHVVLPGETLWGIASGLAPKADPRDTIARIVEFNALPSSAVRAGQNLAIPPGLPGR